MFVIVNIESTTFPKWYVLSRLFWMALAIILAIASSLFFHRFDIKEKLQPQRETPEFSPTKSAGFQLKNLQATADSSSGLMPLVCAELILLIRKNVTWLWILTIIGMVSMIFVPMDFAHKYLLPTLNSVRG